MTAPGVTGVTVTDTGADQGKAEEGYQGVHDTTPQMQHLQTPKPISLAPLFARRIGGGWVHTVNLG